MSELKINSLENNYVDVDIRTSYNGTVGWYRDMEYSITINHKDKYLLLDWNSGKLIVTGDLEYDEAADKFLKSLGERFDNMITERAEELLEKNKL